MVKRLLNAVRKMPPNKRKKASIPRLNAPPSEKKSAKFFIDKLARNVFKGAYKSSVIKAGNRRAKIYIISRVAGPLVASKLDILRKRLDANLKDYSLEFTGTLNPNKNYQDIEIRISVLSDIPENDKIRFGSKRAKPKSKATITASEDNFTDKIKNYVDSYKPIGVIYADRSSHR